MPARRPSGKAARAAIVVTIVAVIMNMVLDLGSSGFYATFGVFILLVLSDFGGPLKTRFLAYLVTGAVGLVLITLGALAATSLAATLIVTAVVAFALGYVLVLRGYVNAAYLSLLLPYIVSVTTPQKLDTLPTALGAYAAGTVVAAVTAVALWPSRPSSRLSQALGTAVAAAADLVAASPALDPTSSRSRVEARMKDLVAADEAVHKIFDGDLEREGIVSARERALVRVIDDVGRLRFSLGWTTDEADGATSADADLLRATHRTLAHCGSALRGEEALGGQEVRDLYEARDRHIAGLPESADELLAAGRPGELVQTVNTAFRYRVTSFIAAMLARHAFLALGHRAPDSDGAGTVDPVRAEMSRIDAVSAPLHLLRANLTFRSPWFRRAVQIALAVTVAVGVIHELHLTTGFWVVLGIVASLQLTAIRSRKSALSVAVGTAAGFAICAALVYLVGHNMLLLICLLPVVAFLTVWVPRGKLAVPVKQAGYTVWFVLLVSLSHHDLTLQVDESRIIDVGTGLVVSLLVTAVLWPRGVASRVREVLDSSVRATAGFFAATYSYFASAMTAEDEAAVSAAAQHAVAGRDRATEAYDLAISQGGSAEEDAAHWMVVNNAVDHAFFAGSMVRGLAAYGLAPAPDAGVARELESAARRAADEFAESINGSLDRPAGTPPAGSSHDALSAGIGATIAGWASGPAEVSFEIPPSTFSMSRGHAAISLLWAQDWLTYFRWMAVHSQPARADDPPAQEARPVR